MRRPGVALLVAAWLLVASAWVALPPLVARLGTPAAVAPGVPFVERDAGGATLLCVSNRAGAPYPPFLRAAR